MRDATRVVHAGLPPAEQGEPFLPGPVLAGPYHLAGDPAQLPYGYGRQGNPTWDRYEAALGELEGGPSVLFASGMAACAATLRAVLAAGDTLLLPADGYYLVRRMAAEDLAPAGVRVREVSTDTDAVVGALDGVRLVWLETPSNPALDVVDVAAVAETARARGALVAVDNTLATPLLQRPLELGADLSVASATKALTGHSDLVLGHVACADPALAERIRAVRTRTGAIAGPVEAWLAHRSLATLDVRLERQCATAQAVAEALAARDDVAGVRYPGLPGHPGRELAARQMRGRFGMVLGFDVGSRERAEAVLDACRVVTEATSFGGVHTVGERRARWGDPVPEGYVRVSVGLEHAADLVADLAAALDAVPRRASSSSG